MNPAKKSNSITSGGVGGALPQSNTKVLSALIKSVNKTKFSPCQSCPTLASNIIDRYFSASLRQRKTQGHKAMPPLSPDSDPSLMGATNATLFNSFQHAGSPTSSLISLNNAGCGANNASVSSHLKKNENAENMPRK